MSVNSFNVDLLTVMGVLAGLSALLFFMSALDPTNVQRQVASHPVDLDVATPPMSLGEQAHAQRLNER